MIQTSPESPKGLEGTIVLVLGKGEREGKFGGGPARFHSALTRVLARDPAIRILRDPRNDGARTGKAGEMLHVVKELLFKPPSTVLVTSFGLHFLIALIFRPLLRYRIVWAVHSLQATNSKETVEPGLTVAYVRDRLLRGPLERCMLATADVSVFPSALFLKRAKDAGYDLTRALVIGHGVPREWLVSHPRAKAPGNQCLVLSGFWEAKGTRLLQIIAAGIPGTMHLRWVGMDEHDTAQRIEMNHLKLSVPANCRVEAWISASKILELLDECSILLVPSSFETFGMVVLEAAARGLPAVVSPGVGAAALVTTFKAGVVADFASEEALRAAVTRILAEYTAFSANAVAMARANTWDTVASQYAAVLCPPREHT